MRNYTAEGFVLIAAMGTDKLPGKFQLVYDPNPQPYDPNLDAHLMGLEAEYEGRRLFLLYHPSIDTSVKDAFSVSIYDVLDSGEKRTLARGTLFKSSSRFKFEEITL